MFIGYGGLHKGYKCLDVATGRVYISRDVVFMSSYFPFLAYILMLARNFQPRSFFYHLTALILSLLWIMGNMHVMLVTISNINAAEISENSVHVGYFMQEQFATEDHNTEGGADSAARTRSPTDLSRASTPGFALVSRTRHQTASQAVGSVPGGRGGIPWMHRDHPRGLLLVPRRRCQLCIGG